MELLTVTQVLHDLGQRQDLTPHEMMVVRSAMFLVQQDQYFAVIGHPHPPKFYDWELGYTALDGTTTWTQPEGGGIVNVRMMEPNDWMWN